MDLAPARQELLAWAERVLGPELPRPEAARGEALARPPGSERRSGLPRGEAPAPAARRPGERPLPAEEVARRAWSAGAPAARARIPALVEGRGVGSPVPLAPEARVPPRVSSERTALPGGGGTPGLPGSLRPTAAAEPDPAALGFGPAVALGAAADPSFEPAIDVSSGVSPIPDVLARPTLLAGGMSLHAVEAGPARAFSPLDPHLASFFPADAAPTDAPERPGREPFLDALADHLEDALELRGVLDGAP